jgi:hypothetical protein
VLAHYVALALAVWATVHPRAPRLADAPAIARAWAQAVDEDTRPPVFGSKDRDCAIGAYWALRESWLNAHAVGDAGKSHGAWQEQTAAGKADLLTQARAWRDLLRAGARVCPASPAAPLSGGCEPGHKGRKLADRRVRNALRALDEARAEGPI